jgi:hypothetical protein
LHDERIAVIAQYRGGRIIAGAIANRSATVVGLSNVFHAGGDLEPAWAGSASVAVQRWGELPVVAYDSGPSLDAARAEGFESVGDVVIWLKLTE